MSQCNAHIRPFPNATEIDCEQDYEHTTHHGVARDYAYPGSETVVEWMENDRRNFHGEWPGACTSDGCILPLGHRGNHAA